MEEQYITQEGYDKIKKELEKLKTVDRIEVAKAIGEAKSFGDLSENSEYDAAKNREAELESKIYELENVLKNSKVIDKSSISNKVVGVGCTVTLFDEDFEEEVTYKIMSAAEGDPLNGVLSSASPVGKALIGKKANDKVVVETPGGSITYKILKITV